MNATLPPAQPWLIEVPTRALTKTVRQEWQEYTSSCEAEKGLVLSSTAAKLLGVSSARIAQLLARGKLTKFDHLGHTWVSATQLMDRLASPVDKGGRPRLDVAA
jgi:hypothetical protein